MPLLRLRNYLYFSLVLFLVMIFLLKPKMFQNNCEKLVHNVNTLKYKKIAQQRVKQLKDRVKPLTWPYYLEITQTSILKNISVDFYKGEDKKYISDRLETMISRIETVKKFCVTNKQTETRRRWDQFIWFNKDSIKIIYFPIFKVASTTMSSYFLYAANYWSKNPSFLSLPQKQKEEERFSKRWGWTQTNAYKVFKMPETLEDRVKLLRESIRIVLVRHPFSRVLSTYLFRISQYRKGEKEIFEDIRKHIIKTYRSKNIMKISEEYPTFQEFVTYLIDNENLIQDDRIDKLHHLFMKQSRTCDVCLIDPTIVMKLESFEEDFKFLGLFANVKEWIKRVDFPYEVRHPTSAWNNSVIYFRQLSLYEIKSLYRIYKDDFLIFGYTIEEFLGDLF